jgi:hypothetical protein
MPMMLQKGIIILQIKILKKQGSFIFLVLFQFILLANTQAEIFKCTNLKGAVYYNDKPCPKDNKEQKIKAQKDVLNGYVPSDTSLAKSDKTSLKSSSFKMKNEKHPDSKTNHKKTSEQGDTGHKKAISTLQDNTAVRSTEQKIRQDTLNNKNNDLLKPVNSRIPDSVLIEADKKLPPEMREEELFINSHVGDNLQETTHRIK